MSDKINEDQFSTAVKAVKTGLVLATSAGVDVRHLLTAMVAVTGQLIGASIKAEHIDQVVVNATETLANTAHAMSAAMPQRESIKDALVSGNMTLQ